MSVIFKVALSLASRDVLSASHCRPALKEGLVFFFWLVHILLDMLSESRMHGDTCRNHGDWDGQCHSSHLTLVYASIDLFAGCMFAVGHVGFVMVISCLYKGFIWDKESVGGLLMTRGLWHFLHFWWGGLCRFKQWRRFLLCLLWLEPHHFVRLVAGESCLVLIVLPFLCPRGLLSQLT